MKRFALYISLSAAVFAAIACTRIDEVSPAPASDTKRLTVHATWGDGPAAGTKTELQSDKVSVYWSPADDIKLFYGDKMGKFTSTNTVAAPTADFDGELVLQNRTIDVDKYCAIYPYSSSTQVWVNKRPNGFQFNLPLPSVQEAVDGGFADAFFPAVAVSEDTSLKFYNVCGGACFTVAGEGITEVIFTAANETHLSGMAIAVLSDENNIPVHQFTNGGYGRSVTVRKSDGSPLVPGVRYYAAFIPQELPGGLCITYCKGDSTATFRIDKPITIQRSRFGELFDLDEGLTFTKRGTQFPDPWFELYCLDNFDTDGDRFISESEATEVKWISLSPYSQDTLITSLAGIELFVNLESFVCYANPYPGGGSFHFRNLDLSRNTKIGMIQAINGVIEKLNVSGCPELENLICHDNNLTLLDISNNSLLTQLDCNGNKLSSLDVSNNTALGLLDCGSNQLTGLDVRNNTALTGLNCSSNQLTSLDISKNTALTSLYCYRNQLTALDVSNNTALSYLYCAENPSLSELWLKEGQTITKLLKDDHTVIKYKGEAGYVVFGDAIFKAYCVQNFDTDGDGEMSLAEAANVTRISVSTDDISSLAGVEHFHNLTDLQCSGTYIWNNDLKEYVSYGKLSELYVGNNTALRELTCYANQLTSLDVSNNTALGWLDCHGNQLTALNVSNNTALTGLNCSDNQLTALDVSNNTALTSLGCSDNQLTALDVSNNTALTGLSCSDNQLTALDVSNNTALKNLSCGDNQLTSLDISKNTALNNLNCNGNQLTALNVSNNTALAYLFCLFNQLTALDVSKNTALIEFSCVGNQLTSLDVSNNTALSYLYCAFNPSLSELWLKEGQTLTTLNKDDHTVIKYK